MINKIFDVVIIGAGPIGLFTAFQIGMQEMSTIIIDNLEVIGGQCAILYPDKFIYDIPGHEKITARDLITNLEAQAKQFSTNEFLLGQEVISFNEYESYFQLFTNKGATIFARTIVIAAGCGSFNPHKPDIKNLEKFEKEFVHYLITDLSLFKNKKIAIAGGGDSAVDWTVMLAPLAKKIYFIHRRSEMRAHPHSLQQLNQLVEQGIVELNIPYIGHELIGEAKLEKIILKNFSDHEIQIECEIDYFLPFFGLKSDINNIKNWNLMIEKNKINVDYNMATNLKGIYAVGDICYYPGKTKLLVSGFHEACVVANSINSYLIKEFDKKMVSFSYSTSKF